MMKTPQDANAIGHPNVTHDPNGADRRKADHDPNVAHDRASSACPDESTLQMYAEGILSGPELRQTATHVAACSPCRQGISQYKQLMWDLQQVGANLSADEPSLTQSHAAQYSTLMLAWQAKQAEATSETRAMPRRLLPAWAGYGLRWTRNLPGVARLQAALPRPNLSPRVMWRTAARGIINRWSSR